MQVTTNRPADPRGWAGAAAARFYLRDYERSLHTTSANQHAEVSRSGKRGKEVANLAHNIARVLEAQGRLTDACKGSKVSGFRMQIGALVSPTSRGFPKVCVLLNQIASNRVAEGQRPGKIFRVCSGGNRQLFNLGNVEAQSLLGVEEFAEGLRPLVTEKQQIREIPNGQRFVGRASLEKLFSQRAEGKDPGIGSSPKLLQRTAIAKLRWQATCGSTIRRSAESSQLITLKRASKHLMQ